MSENKINIGLVVGEFHYDITENMLNKAVDHAEFLGCKVNEYETQAIARAKKLGLI